MATYIIFGIGAVVLLMHLILQFKEEILCVLRWIIKPYRLIIIVVIIIGLIALILYSGRNADKSTNTKTTYKKCSFCGDRVPEDDMRGKWCKDCQNAAFGEDGWYDKIKD